MGKRLVIAEKPMLAKAILDAIPGTAKSIKAGERVFYTEKGDYLVVALAGHVLQLKEPEDYDPKYKKWTLEDLPIFFPDWAAVPAQGKSDIVRCVKSLLPQADSVIHAGDVDDEGQLIVDELLRYCGYRGKVQRLYTSDTSTAALKKRLGMLEDNAKWEPLGVSAYARSVTDKTFGINFSRLYTKLNGTLLTVGRVQTPAMGLVVARDEAIENHVARKYYALEVQAEIDGRQPYIPAEFSPTKGSPLLGEEDKVWERKGLEEVLAACRGKNFPAKVSKKEETEAPPLPFNLNKLGVWECIVVCMFDRDNVVANTVVRDLDEEMRIIDGLDEFWNDHVLAHIPPEPLGTADGIISTLRRYGGPANPRADRVRLTGDELEELCRQCVEMSLEKARAKKMADEVDARCKELSIGLIAALGNATDGALTSADGTTEYQIRYRPRKAPKKVDFDMLQARYPDAFAACVSQEAEGGRTFGIKAIARN